MQQRDLKMLNDETKKIIKQSSFFSLFSDVFTPEIERLFFDSLILLSVKSGECIYQAGDPATHIYFLVDGLLAIESSLPNQPPKEITKIYPGEPVGIYGVISSTHYPYTLLARRYSRVARLEKDFFDKYLGHNPKVLRRLIEKLVHTTLLSANQESHKNTMTHIALLPANHDMDLSQFYKSFKQALSADHDTVEFFTSENEQSPDESLFSSLRRIGAHDKLKVFLLNPRHTNMSHFFLNHSDKIIVIGNGDTKQAMSKEAASILADTHLKKELILVYAKKTIPLYTTSWLSTASYYRFHHLALNQTDDYERLARFMHGTAIALVLGGGGTRGWVHAGVIKSLLAHNIPIDTIAGTSIGAFAGSNFFKTEDYDVLCQDAMALTLDFKNLFRLSHFTFPFTSILTGKKPTQYLKETFGTRSIESLWRPFFCVSCDLNSSQEYIHRTGSLWQAVRASLSLPALIPPMVINGKSHVDGGIINNLPVDLMREFLDNTGTIIAVNLSSYQDLNFYNSPPELGFWKALKLRYQKATRQSAMDLTEVILRASFAGAYLSLQNNANRADILINPDLRDFSLLKETSPERVEQLIQIGYEEMNKKINLLE